MGTFFAKAVFKIIKTFFNTEVAISVYRNLVLKTHKETYNFDARKKAFFRVDWSKPLSSFPSQVDDVDELRYQRVLRFCKMTEIKIAQGAKQTGGKLLAKKVTEAIAYYRGIPANKDLFSPNRFPYATTIEELFDFVGKLQRLSSKPVGIKIVISTQENFQASADTLALRIKENRAYPDFFNHRRRR